MILYIRRRTTPRTASPRESRISIVSTIARTRVSSRREGTRSRRWTTPRTWCRNTRRLRRDTIEGLTASSHPSLRKGKCKDFIEWRLLRIFVKFHLCEFTDTSRWIRWIRPHLHDRHCTRKAQWSINRRHIATRRLLRNRDINLWRRASRFSRLSNLAPIVGSPSFRRR